MFRDLVEFLLYHINCPLSQNIYLQLGHAHYEQQYPTTKLLALYILLPLALQPTVGFSLSNNVLPFFPICHQLSPSSHSQHLKISFYFLFPSFPGCPPSSRHGSTCTVQPNHSSLQQTYGHFSFTYRSRPQLQGWGSSSLFCTYEVLFCSDRLTFFPCFCGQPFRITCTSSPTFWTTIHNSRYDFLPPFQVEPIV